MPDTYTTGTVLAVATTDAIPPPTTTGVLMGLRADVATALETIPEVVAGDWTVHGGPVDAVSPPAFMLVWPEPWLEPTTFCAYTAQIQVVCIAGRVEPDPGYVTLELMIEAAIAALSHPIGVPRGAAPGPFEIGGVRYLAARLTVSQLIGV